MSTANKDSWPKISLVTPSYNQAQFIRETIESVLGQNYPALEYFILDAKSTDGSVDIIKSYERGITWWTSEKDKGQSDAINKGFQRATGDLIGWLNSDDVLLPGALKRVGEAYQANPQGRIFAGHFALIDADGKLIRCKRMPSQASWFARRGIFTVATPGSFFHRESYRAAGLNNDLHYNMDTDLYMRMLINGAPYVHLDTYLAGFRVHANAKTTEHKDLTMKEMEAVVSRLWPVEVAREYGKAHWRLAYRALQFMNGNYLRMFLETAAARNKYWKEWANAS